MPDDNGAKPSAFPDVTRLMAGKRGLIMGVANERSIAWGITQALHAAGAEMAFTYQGAAFGKRLRGEQIRILLAIIVLALDMFYWRPF